MANEQSYSNCQRCKRIVPGEAQYCAECTLKLSRESKLAERNAEIARLGRPLPEEPQDDLLADLSIMGARKKFVQPIDRERLAAIEREKEGAKAAERLRIFKQINHPSTASMGSPLRAPKEPWIRNEDPAKFLLGVLIAAGCIGILVILFVVQNSTNNSKPFVPGPNNNASSIATLTAQQNGYAWNAASVELRMALCADMARRGGDGSRDAKWYYDCVDNFYNSNPTTSVLEQTIGTPAGLGTFIDREQRQ